MNQETKMGRPKQTDDERQQKVDKIIAIAQSLFVTEGYLSVSMRKIAAKAGMGTMTLYKYFPNKNAILHHLWADFFDELFTLVRAGIDPKQDARIQLKQVCMIYLNYWVQHKDRFRVVFLNEDRASSADDFFLNQANIAQEMLVVVGPLIQQIAKSIDHSSMMAFLESLMCFVNGIALNVITISEYPWSDYEKYIDIYLKATLEANDI